MSLPGILLEEFSVDAGSPAKLFALDPKVGVVQEDPDADVDRRPRHSRKHFRYKKCTLGLTECNHCEFSWNRIHPVSKTVPRNPGGFYL